MPSSLKFLYKKGRPRLGKKKNKIYSLAKRKGNRHVDRKMLDNMLSPVYSVTKKDYGISTVFYDTGATSTDIPDSGNMSSLQCLPGRQVYLEFAALPIRPPTHTATGITKSTYILPWSFIDLLYGAYKRNRAFTQNANQVTDPANFAWSTATGSMNLPNTAGGGMGAGQDTIMNSTSTLFTFVENTLSNAAFNFKFKYMGGHQTHKFMNTTTLPIHGEVREFTPRQCMTYDLRRRTIAASNQTCQIYPGMYSTLLADRIRLENRESTAADAGGSAYNYVQDGLYNEIDDRNFKYKPGMEETNFRWVVGPAKKFTIYPGETFTYKMVIPPFSGDSFQFIKNIQRQWTNLGGASEAEVEWGNTPSFAPGFSKFCQIRLIGSNAYKLPRYSDNDATYDPNYVNDASNDAIAGSNAFGPYNNANRPILHSATHSVRVTHTVCEHHSMRTFPTFDGRIHIFKDSTANAESGADITRTDQMVFIDASGENNQEGIPGDN